MQFFFEGLCRRAEALAGHKGVMPGKGVRDVPAEAFIKAYAAHLKSNDNVCLKPEVVHRKVVPAIVPAALESVQPCV